MRCHGNLGHPDPNSRLQAEPSASPVSPHISRSLYGGLAGRRRDLAPSPFCFAVNGKHTLICVFVSFIHSFNNFLLRACLRCVCRIFVCVWVFLVSQSLAL